MSKTAKKVAGFVASEKGQFVQSVGVVMGERIRAERRRNGWHFIALWAAVIVTFVVACLR